MFNISAVARDLLQVIRDSIGDAGTSPTNTAGKTVLQLLTDIYSRTRSLDGDTGTQVVKSGDADNATTIIHTVTAGKTLYLVAFVHCVYAGASGSSKLFIRDTGDALVYKISAGSIAAGGTQEKSISGSFMPPIKVPEGYDICVDSNAAGLAATGFIFGWEE